MRSSRFAVAVSLAAILLAITYLTWCKPTDSC